MSIEIFDVGFQEGKELFGPNLFITSVVEVGFGPNYINNWEVFGGVISTPIGIITAAHTITLRARKSTITI